jgi:diguanylate cyclase (GGDEF)-like protein/PAS domain S-box-containing protein
MPLEHAVPWHRSIRLKLVATAILVEVVMLTLLLANSYRLVSDALESQTRVRLEALAPLIDTSLSGRVFQRDRSEISAIIKQLVGSEHTDIRYIVVFDRRGEILGSAGKLTPELLSNTAPEDKNITDALVDLTYDTSVPLTQLGNKVGSVRLGLSIIELATLRGNVLQQSLLIALGEILLSLLLLATGAYLILRHIDSLVAATRRIANADYSSPIVISSHDEIGVLADNFNTMSATVQNRIQELAESETRFRNIFDAAGDAFFIYDIATGQLLDVNQRMCDMYGCTREQALQSSLADISADVEPYTLVKAAKKMRLALEEGPQTFDWLARRFDGQNFWVEVKLQRTRIGMVDRLISQVRDITARKKAEDEINTLAFYDPLTLLPNRRLLLDRLKQALAYSIRNEKYAALLFIDLDDFKTLNDTLGHDIGDLLLQQVAQRLSKCVRNTDTVSRVGGDEFVVILEDLSENIQKAASQTELVGEKVLMALNQPYQLNSHTHHSTPSIGATLFVNHQGSMDDLLKRADLAMYQAKESGRNTMRFFDPEMQSVISARVALEADMREAILKEQFALYYQAQVVGNGRLTGAEVLIRWQHSERGFVSPAEFIPLAEETGLILLIGHWVLQTACVQLAKWAAQPEMAHLTIAVNVSPRQFRMPTFVKEVLAVIGHTGANPHRLKLELTESLLVDDVDDIISKMTDLKEKGIGFSMDDFGTGYSSLSYLKKLPLDQLKIDQSFVRNIITDPNDAAISRMVIVLAESLGLGVIAEGVENKEQMEFLADQGCNAYQGYFFSRPLPLKDFEEFAKQA